jgi:hypothetical protein
MRKTIHFTWDQAWRAESEREKARLACCNEVPTAGPVKLFVANVAKELPHMRARAFRYLAWMSFSQRQDRNIPRKRIPAAAEQGDQYVIMNSREEPRRRPDRLSRQ